jgi:CRISPR-associated protein (TIGR03986 family)
MNPQHLEKIPDERKAVAPYNFVQLPEKVVEAQLECNGKLRNNNRYYSDRNTGKIICTLKTESPLYTRCGLTPDDFANFGDKSSEDLTTEERHKYAQFFQYPSNPHPVLTGSSLRGMVRNLVEIISFSKIEKVSDQQKFFFRAVAAENDDPLKDKYTDYIGNLAKNVAAGYLENRDDKWFIRPAITNDSKSFIPVKEENINSSNVPSLIKMYKDNYLPQYIKISYQLEGKTVNLSENCDTYNLKGVLVTSGNMLDTVRTTEKERKALLRRKEGRKYHYIVLNADNSATPIEISADAIRYYLGSLTDFQKGKPFKENPKNPFNEKMGFLEPGRPVFYCQSKTQPSVVTLFGQSPNFRIPYSPDNNGQAASAFDFIPKKISESDTIDLADAIFGFVRRRKEKIEQDLGETKTNNQEKSRAGRVFFTDAQYQADEDGIWLTNDTITPHILASPKPTTFQHYLVQTDSEKKNLTHYASKPNEDTVIRGNKLYWHQGNVGINQIKTDATEDEIKDKQSQHTEIKPIKAGVSFEFTIYFENLSDVELGALLWVLTLSVEDAEKIKLLSLGTKEKYRLSLGMGKPLGMGAVMIEKYQLVLNERYRNEPKQRYTQLFDGDEWLSGEYVAGIDEHAKCIHRFEEYIINGISKTGYPQNNSDEENSEKLKLKDIPRIQMLLAMLRWDIFPPATRTRYMEIERDVEKDYLCSTVKQGDKTVNEYKCRLVLPTPFEVINIPDNRKRTLVEEDAVESPHKDEINKPKQNFEIGQILDAKVNKISGVEVTYEMLDGIKRSTNEHKKAKFLQEGQTVQVEIKSLRSDGSIKSIKLSFDD